MQALPDTSTLEMARTRLTLRADLRFIPQRYQDQQYYHIECRSSSEYHRIGYAEYVFVSLLDGHTTFSEALAVTARTLGPLAFPQHKAMQLYVWLLESGLGQVTESDKRPADKARQASGQLSGISRWNPFWIRIPLGKPDWLLAALNPLMGWLFTGTATLIALLLMMAAGLELATEWTRFASDSSQVFASGNWIWLLVAWLGLKLLHETAHGLVCRRYGGTVQDSGVILAFFAPLAYVDVTSSWAFRSRWQRIHTALAGMYIELVVASLAVFGWSWSTDAVWSSLFYNVILMAGLSTVLFNANPLMRFDGYYVLSDLLQIPNLYSQAGQAVQRLTERIVFGFRTAGPTTRHAAETVLQVYGFAALFWRILIMLSMLIAASMMLHGAGLVLTIAGVFAWCATPLWKLIVRLRQVAVESPARLIRAAVVTAGLSVAMVGGCLFVPAPFTTVAPAVVELPDGSLVRAAVDGFVQTVHVREGDRVDRGDLLLTLENRQVETEHRNLAVEIEQEQIRYQTAVRDHDADKAAIAQSNLRSLRQRLTETQERYDSLEIRASVSGTIVARTLASMPQTFVKEGDEVLAIDTHDSKRVTVSIAQQDHGQVQQLVNQPMQIRFGLRPRVTGQLVRLNPRASRQIPHPALAATAGGPLAVTEVGDSYEDNTDTGFELVEDRFDAVIELSGDVSEQLCAGECGYASLGLRRESIGACCCRVIGDWLNRQFEQALQASRS